MKKNNRFPIASGYGGMDVTLTGDLLRYDGIDKLISQTFEDKIFYIDYDLPLYEAAIITSLSPKGVILAFGGKNYHPLIFFKDALIPCIAGVGYVDFKTKFIVMDCENGSIYASDDYIKLKPYTINKTSISNVYANIGSERALEVAYETGAKGIGILRTEFIIVRALADCINLEIKPNLSVKEMVLNSNEADVIYELVQIETYAILFKDYLKKIIQKAVRFFKNKPVIIRSIDIERHDNDPMGYRGIRRCIAENGGVFRIIIQAIKEIIWETNANNIAIIYPLVSDYSQIKYATEYIKNIGLQFWNEQDKNFIKIGWKIEQPASVINNKVWIEAFKEDFGLYPHFLGIGTNDLTQFTLSVSRNVEMSNNSIQAKEYINSLYNEKDYSILFQLSHLMLSIRNTNIEVILHGEIGSDSSLLKYLCLLNIRISMTAYKIAELSVRLEEIMQKELDLQQVIEEVVNGFPFSANIKQVMINELVNNIVKQLK
ncbi:MAG: putative PEP-binding protein [Spirosomataceae bacterium]